MDHQLGDSLNLDNAMGVEFDPAGDEVANQVDVMDSSSHVEGIPMEYEHIKEQPMMMETGHEEIIGAGLMGDQFTIGGDTEYVDMVCSLDQEFATTTVTTSQPQILSGTVMNMQFESQTLNISAPAATIQPKPILVKAPQQPRTPRKLGTAPKEVAIAPKPGPVITKPLFTNKQFSIATISSPVGVSAPRATLKKKVHVTGLGQKADQTVLAQIGKQLVVLPSGGGHKIKLVQSGGMSMAQIVNAKKVVGTQPMKKPVMAKVVVQNQGSPSDQPAVLTQLSPGGAGTGAPRFVTMQQKTLTVPTSIQSKLILGASANTVRLTKPKQTVVAVKSPQANVMSVGKASPGQKFMISMPQSKQFVLKQAFPHIAGANTPGVKSEVKEENVINVAGGQRAELHEVNGIQYIRLVSAPTGTQTISGSKVMNASPRQGQVVALPGPANKTVMYTDYKGNLIRMDKEKVTQPPPPLVINKGTKVTLSKPTQRLVRIAPVMPKTSQASNSQQPRPGRSLLAPITPDPPAPPPASPPPASPSPSPSTPTPRSPVEDSKSRLRQLIEDTTKAECRDVEGNDHSYTDNVHRVMGTEVEVAFERMSSPVQEESEGSPPSPAPPQEEVVFKLEEQHQEHPLIVIPASDCADETEHQDQSTGDSNMIEERFQFGNNYMNINPDLCNYQTSMSPPTLSDNELDNRPRKACNCTKSQCLKLYCDCFANGEFCNRCNCNNCHNNLQHEELRQKAIRGCLDRNPNAFRPKIGKSKAGGPETVRRHNKGCNCKRSGCLKNYCECYEAKIACTPICKCVGCRNVEEALERLLRRREAHERRGADSGALYRPPPLMHVKQPCTFMTSEVIEAVCQCLLAAAAERDTARGGDPPASPAPPADTDTDPVRGVIDEFTRCLQDIISAAQQGPPLHIDEGPIM